jgi:hypothetical protein
MIVRKEAIRERPRGVELAKVKQSMCHEKINNSGVFAVKNGPVANN